jgi:hypothetical protein
MLSPWSICFLLKIGIIYITLANPQVLGVAHYAITGAIYGVPRNTVFSSKE